MRAQNQNFFRLFFVPFSYLFVVVVDLPLGLLPVEEFPRKDHQDGQFLPRSSQVQWREFALRFNSNFTVSLMFSNLLCIDFQNLSKIGHVIKANSKQHF